MGFSPVAFRTKLQTSRRFRARSFLTFRQLGVWIHSETRTSLNKNLRSSKILFYKMMLIVTQKSWEERKVKEKHRRITFYYWIKSQIYAFNHHHLVIFLTFIMECTFFSAVFFTKYMLHRYQQTKQLTINKKLKKF